MNYKIKSSYISKLSLLETIDAKEIIRKKLRLFLKKEFKLKKVEPIMVTENKVWLNDDFNSSERPIDFDTNMNVFGQLVQTNIKYRRKLITDLELNKTNFLGVITDGIFVRRDRQPNNTSAIVYNELGFDILNSEYNEKYIKDILEKIYSFFLKIDNDIENKYLSLEKKRIESKLTFVTSKQLKVMYPLLSFEERLNIFGRDNGSFILSDFVKSVLDKKDFSKYSQDTFDFDTYCELYLYNKSIQESICVVGAGYQVVLNQLKTQTKLLREDWKGNTDFENWIKNNALTNTVSVSIDFSRLVMTILEKQHIGEVIASVWEDEFIKFASENGISIL